MKTSDCPRFCENGMVDFHGKFIVLDGPDGCGKSTQARRLTEWVRAAAVEICSYRDPGTTVIGERIREILLDPAHGEMGDNVEVMLYMAARAQLWKERISTDLTAGRCVIMDRWLSSTCAYQGWAGGFGIEKVIRIAEDTLERVWPDVTVILDVDPETAAGRMNRQLDRMEQKGAAYHRRVREGFLKLAKLTQGVVVVNAGETVETVEEHIRREIEKRL